MVLHTFNAFHLFHNSEHHEHAACFPDSPSHTMAYLIFYGH